MPPFGSAPLFGERLIGTHQAGMIGVTLLMLGLLYLFFRGSRLGLAMRAAATNPESARLVGIRVGWMIALGWGMSAAVGAVAGMLIAPVVFLEPTRIYRALKEEVSDDGESLPLDTAFILREGKDVTLVSWGAVVRETLGAANALAEDGISAEVIDLATLKPYDEDALLASVSKTGRCVIVHEAARTGGFGAEIAAFLAERGLMSLLAPIERVTGYDTIMPLHRLESYYLPSTERIVAGARRAVAFA